VKQSPESFNSWTGGPLFSSTTAMNDQHITIRVATASDKVYSKTITDEMEASAAARGTGIAKRSPDYIDQKIDEGKAVIALTQQNEWVGFCYIETA
jgi:hypothetical protein